MPSPFGVKVAGFTSIIPICPRRSVVNTVNPSPAANSSPTGSAESTRCQLSACVERPTSAAKVAPLRKTRDEKDIRTMSALPRLSTLGNSNCSVSLATLVNSSSSPASFSKRPFATSANVSSFPAANPLSSPRLTWRSLIFARAGAMRRMRSNPGSRTAKEGRMKRSKAVSSPMGTFRLGSISPAMRSASGAVKWTWMDCRLGASAASLLSSLVWIIIYCRGLGERMTSPGSM